MKPARLATTSGVVRRSENDLLTLENAVDRALAAVLVAAADEPSIFLGPIAIWLGERGTALQLIDGRTRQPGKGHDRPRGHIGPPPDGAYVPVSALPSALAAAHALAGGKTMRELGALAAKTSKHRLLVAVRERGGQALADRTLLEAFRETAGPLAGGIYSPEDVAELALDAARPGATQRTAEWDAPVRSLEWAAVATSDPRGRQALAIFGWDAEGISISGLEARAPKLAVPVRRSVERVQPGALLDGLPSLSWKDDGTFVTFEIGLPAGTTELKISH